MRYTKTVVLCHDWKQLETLGRTRVEGGVDATPLKVFLTFLLEGKTSAPDVFSSCWFIPCAHFESSSVMVSFYG